MPFSMFCELHFNFTNTPNFTKLACTELAGQPENTQNAWSAGPGLTHKGTLLPLPI